MIYDDEYLGCPCGVEGLKTLNDQLNAQVVERVNDTQELVMINSFALETDEFQFNKCLRERISDVASWRWVLADLLKRLEEAAGALRHEHKALRVVTQRVQGEVDGFSREASRPGALSPLTDSVEDAIKQEFDFLRAQYTRFEKMSLELEKQIAALERTKKIIEEDVYNKEQAISVDENCAKINLTTENKLGNRKKTKKKLSPILRWEKKCKSLKDAGLKALSNAIVTRQQLRGARVQLSISAQAYAARVDSALRRRLHANEAKVQELTWQREEALRDLQALDQELNTTERSLIENMEQEGVVEARLVDRTYRPPGELTRDDVDRKLRDELARLRRFTKDLRSNLARITSLQNHLSSAIARIDCCGEDILQVVRLDDERIRSRFGDLSQGSSANFPNRSENPVTPTTPRNSLTKDAGSEMNSERGILTSSSGTSRSKPIPSGPTELEPIKEEDDDDYPFDY